MSRTAGAVICGAGIAGVSAAYHLSKAGLRDILLLDPLPPLSLTSDRSTECYRNWWPDPAMVALMNRSIDLLEQLAQQSGNVFRMNRRGYLYLTGDAANLEGFRQRAARVAALGAGPLRIHSSRASDYDPRDPGISGGSSGADLLLEPSLIRHAFPYVTEHALAALHVRRAGWLSAQQLGMYLLEQARADGVCVERATVESIDTSGGRMRGVTLASGEHVDCPVFVNAAGPYLGSVGAQLGLELPVRTELHLKLSFSDHLRIIGREAPLLIWDDAQLLPWEPSERVELAAEADTRWLTELLPAGAHVRPEGSADSTTVLMLWDYRERWMEPVFPTPLDEFYAEVALRGLSTMLPGLARYFGRASRPFMDGGYYVKTPENRLMAGPLPVQGAFVIGALSGFGIMSSCAAGELLAAHVASSPLPSYAADFSPARYDDPAYQEKLRHWDHGGEL